LTVANIAATKTTGETMTEPVEKGELIYENVDTAPIVYFDIAPAHGVIGGAVQIELAVRILKCGVRRKRRNQVHHERTASM
jgi:hypothetical protein